MKRHGAHYRIKRPASGSFVTANGRLNYAVEPGVIAAADIDPDVLRVLVAAGVAVKTSKPTEEAEA